MALLGRPICVSRDPSGLADDGAVGAWRDVAVERFRAVFSALGVETIALAHPEIYADASLLTVDGAPDAAIGARPPIGVDGAGLAGVGLAGAGVAEGPAPAHLSFRSLARLNYLKGGRNIVLWPWRYPSFRASAPGGPRSDAPRLLSLADQVWCSSEAAAQTLRAQGIARAVAAPAPISAAAPSRRAARRIEGYAFRYDPTRPGPPVKRRLDALLDAEGGRTQLFVAVLDPDDAFAHIEPLLRGFALAARGVAAGRPKLSLAIALALDPIRRAARKPAAWVEAIGRGRLTDDADVVCDDILLIPRALEPAELNGLFDLADFYLSTTSRTDQNLALQTAMSRGAIPVATIGAEAAAYLGPQASTAAAVAIETGPSHLPPDADAAGAADAWVPVDAPSARSVAEACLRAAALTPDRRSELSASAARIADAFSVRAAADRARAAFAELDRARPCDRAQRSGAPS